MPDPLVLGPLLRHVDETSAAIWVETGAPATVTVRTSVGTWQARTFAVHGHSYALVEVEGLEPGSVTEYAVDVDGREAWPPAGSDLPPSRIRTLRPDQELRLAFGSCRMSLPHDEPNNRKHGVDALRAYARNMMRSDPTEWPDLVLFVGDQVYADETSEQMQKFIARRRDISEPPGTELKDFEEYTHLYFLAWTDPINRWLLSTLPSAMIFDDHDIRDDWNTSAQWRREISRKPWWHDRIVGGLASYWIYQHLGNLSPESRAKDEMWAQIAVALANDGGGHDGRDWGETLDIFAARADEHPDTYQWSYARDVGRNRLIVIDSRAARVLTPERRSIVDDEEMAWLDARMQGGFDHVFVGTSLPFMLSKGLHYFEAWNEAVSTGAWGRPAAVAGERIRRAVDLEHWAAFHEGFRKVSAMAEDVVRGGRGEAPGSVTFLAGDVHHSYIAEAEIAGARGRLVQAVCSPIRNVLPASTKVVMAALSRPSTARIGRWLAHRAGVPDPAFDWEITHGPWYDNNLATLETHGKSLSMRWEAGVEEPGDEILRTVSEFTV